MKFRLTKRTIMSVCVSVAVAGCILSAVSVSAANIEVIAQGLNNPRGLTFGPEGALYVVEAGIGGSGPCILGGEGQLVCLGQTGAITRIWQGSQSRVVEGLPSLADEQGFGALGPHDLSMLGRGAAYLVTGLGAPPLSRDELGVDGARLGHLIQVTASGNTRLLADLAAYEQTANPDQGAVDTNPYGILAIPGGRLIADAGANALLFEKANGGVSTVAVFPDRMVDAPDFLGLPPGTQIPMQAVPTSVAQGPDKAYYVGQLTGFPFPVGGANVYRITPGGVPEVYASGFTNIVDIAFGKDGALYVLELAHNGLLSGDLTGAVIRIAPDGTRTTIATEGLVSPGGIAIGDDGIYVTNYGIFPGAGQVLRITP